MKASCNSPKTLNTWVAKLVSLRECRFLREPTSDVWKASKKESQFVE
jgi:hypothetical protein